MFKSKTLKILVNVKGDPIDYTVKRKVNTSSDGQKVYVVMTPPTKLKPAGWTLNVKGKIRHSMKGYYVDAIEGQNEALTLNIPDNSLKGHDMTTDEIKEFANMNIFKARYGKLLGDLIAAIKPYLLVLAVVVCVSIALGGYNVYALSKIPEQISNMIPRVTPVPTPPLIG